MSSAADLFASARRRLAEAGVPREALGVVPAPGRILRRAPRIQRVGEAWRVGTLLVADDAVHTVGDVVRAAAEVRRGYAAESARERAAQRAAAVRGGFSEGAVVHVGWTTIDLDAVARGEASGPLRVDDGVPLVRWTASGGFLPLEAYLRERVDLLCDPPGGA